MTFIPQESYSKKDLVECGNGALFTKDGDGRLPSDQMLMFDEITNINDFGGEYGKGKIVANLKINPDLWFFKCHFKEDPVMPGCLGLRCNVAVIRILFALVWAAWDWESIRCREYKIFWSGFAISQYCKI